MKGPGRRWQAISYGNRKLPRDNTEKTAAAKAKSKKGMERARCFQAVLFSIWTVCAAETCQRGEEKKKEEKKKKKKKSNKEVDISRAHPRALNTFLLHFNGFLKPILMQIKACLSKHSQKPGLGLVGKPGSPSHPRSGVTVAWLPSPQGHLMCRSTLWMCWMLNSCDLVLYFMHNCVFSPLKKASLHNFGRRGKNQAPKPTWSFTM